MFFLYSDREYTFEQVYELAREISLKPLPTFNIPTPVAKLAAKAIDMLPYNQMISPDLIQRVSLLIMGCIFDLLLFFVLFTDSHFIYSDR